MILKSGGVVRELIRIASVCCSKCLLEIRRDRSRDDIKINSDILNKALTDIRNDFAVPLNQRHYKLLVKIYRDLIPDPDMDNDQDFRNLLHGLFILEYRNDDLWFDVHPIVYDLLKRQGRLLA
jgi:hypothetical protein